MKQVLNVLALGLAAGTGLTLYLSWPRSQAAQVDTNSILKSVQISGELTTAIFNTQVFVTVKKPLQFAGVQVTESKVSYSALGQVRAGVNLANLGPEAVQVVGDRVTLTLPAPTIQDVKLVAEKSGPQFQDRGLLGLGPDTQPLIEAAERDALLRVRQDACHSGVLNQAAEQARGVVEGLLEKSGQTVEVRIQEGHCE